MSHRKRKFMGGVLAGAVALVASVALATPALAASVPAGNLTFTSDDVTQEVLQATIVSYDSTTEPNDVFVYVNGPSNSESVDLTVTPNVLTKDAAVEQVVIGSNYKGTITFEGVTLTGPTLGSTDNLATVTGWTNDGSALVVTGTGTNVILNNCTLTGGQRDTDSGYAAITLADGAESCVITINGCEITGSSEVAGAPIVDKSTPDSDTVANTLVFTGNSEVSGSTASGGSAVLSITGATGLHNLSFPSGTTTFTGTSSTDAAIKDGGADLAIDVDGQVYVDGLAPKANAASNLGGEALDIGAGDATFTGTGEIELTGGNALGVTGNGNAGSALIASSITSTDVVTIGVSDEDTLYVLAQGGNAVASIDDAEAGVGINLGSGTLAVAGDVEIEAIGGNGSNGAAPPANSTPGGAGIVASSTSSVIINMKSGTLTAIGGTGGANSVGGTGIGVKGSITLTGGSITAAGGNSGASGTDITNLPYGDGIVAPQGVTMANASSTPGVGPTLIAGGTTALATAASANTPTTHPLNLGASATNLNLISGNTSRANFYPWLVQTSKELGSTSKPVALVPDSPELFAFFGENNTPTAAASGQWINIGPHPLTAASVSVLQVSGTGAPQEASYVIAEDQPVINNNAENTYKVAVTGTFEGVTDLDTSSFSNLVNVTSSNTAVTPTENVVWKSGGVFYVPNTASGNKLSVSADGMLPTSLTSIYPNVTVSGTTEVPVVYTITLSTPTTMGTIADVNSAKPSNGTLTLWTSATGDGTLVSNNTTTSDNQKPYTVPVTALPGATAVAGTTTNPNPNPDFIGWFNESGETPMQVPFSKVSGYDSNVAYIGEWGDLTLKSVSPTPVTVQQGGSVDVTANFTIKPANSKIVAASFNESGASVLWQGAYVMPDGEAASAASNGLIIPTTTTGTVTGTTTLNATSTVSVSANSDATVGSYRVWPGTPLQNVTGLPSGSSDIFAIVHVVPGEGAPTGTTTVYRLLNPFTGAHLLTADVNEWNTLSDIGWDDEGISFYAAEDGGVPVYRLLNPNNGDHLYTTSLNEYNTLGSPEVGWTKEGICFYGATDSSFPVYRLWNRQQTADEGLGSHLWTPDYNEYRELPTIAPNAWMQEGEAWFAVALAPGTNS